MIFWKILFLLAFISLADGHEIFVDPSDPDGIHEGDTIVLYISVDFNDSYPIEGTKFLLLRVNSNKGLVEFVNGSTFILSDTETTNDVNNISLPVKALFFGYDVLTLHIYPADDDGVVTNVSQASRDVRLRLLRKKDAFDIIFIVAVTMVMIVSNINMGCFLDMEVLRSMFKKPLPIIIGFGCQYLYMPLGSFGVGWLFFDDPLIRLGFFVLGCCPGSAGSNSWTLLFRGDVNLSVVMTFLSTMASFGMMPLWIFTLGQEFFTLGDIQIPYINMVSSLIVFVLPVIFGVGIKMYRPRWAEFSKKIIRPYMIIVMLFFLTVGIYANLYLLRLMTWTIVASGAFIAWGGYVIGGLIAFIFCLNKQQAIAISIETALQNPAIAFVLMKVSLPAPSNDIGIVSPVAQLLVAHVPLWFVYVPYIIHRRCTKRCQREKDVTTVVVDEANATEKRSKSFVVWRSPLKKQRRSGGETPNSIHAKDEEAVEVEARLVSMEDANAEAL